MADTPIVEIEGLWKEYGLPLSKLVRRLRGARRDDGAEDGNRHAWALKDINLSILPGETYGVIGRNGAGKSTLLKILAGVTYPTRGRVKIRGKAFPMISLNAGLHLELTGRENIYTLGAVMGLSVSRIKKFLPEIEEFCELNEFFDRPVRTYSTGMKARLGFAVAMNIDADVLLIDEVLAMGDLAFRNKCIRRLRTFQNNDGKAVIFVSHNIPYVEAVCDRAMILDKGNAIFTGSARETVAEYYRRSGDIYHDKSSKTAIVHNANSGDVYYRRAYVLAPDGSKVDNVTFGEDVRLRIELDVHTAIENPRFSILFDSIETRQSACFNQMEVAGVLEPGRRTIEFFIPKFRMLPGDYFVQGRITHTDGLIKLASSPEIMTLRIEPTADYSFKRNHNGFFEVDGAWEIINGGPR